MLHTNTVQRLTGAILHISSLAVHTTVNTYKRMEISIGRTPQHKYPSEGSNSEFFDHHNEELTSRPKLHDCSTYFLSLNTFQTFSLYSLPF